MSILTRRSHSWWFDSHNRPRQSLWLSATLSELDEKTTKMLKLIEEDADSFAQRAEMYYKKRPELVNMVEDFYRNHRSLAEQFDQLKHESRTRHTTPIGSPTGSWLIKLANSLEKQSQSSNDSFISDESDESEVEDPMEEEIGVNINLIPVQDGKRMAEMEEEMDRLREENRIMKARMLEKDEEKREVIRQLSMSVEILKEENSDLRKCLRDSKKRNLFDFKKLNVGMLSAKMFGAGKTVVAL